MFTKKFNGVEQYIKKSIEALCSESKLLRLKKTKSEIKKELKGSKANGKKNENTDIQEIAENCTANEENAAKVI